MQMSRRILTQDLTEVSQWIKQVVFWDIQRGFRSAILFFKWFCASSTRLNISHWGYMNNAEPKWIRPERGQLLTRLNTSWQLRLIDKLFDNSNARDMSLNSAFTSLPAWRDRRVLLDYFRYHVVINSSSQMKDSLISTSQSYFASMEFEEKVKPLGYNLLKGIYICDVFSTRINRLPAKTSMRTQRQGHEDYELSSV